MTSFSCGRAGGKGRKKTDEDISEGGKTEMKQSLRLQSWVLSAAGL